MNRHPGFLLIAFVCLAVAGFALWPATAHKTPVNLYFTTPQAAAQDNSSSSDSETALDDDNQPSHHNKDETDDATPDYSYPNAI
jgi:hypothetical protein